MQCVVVTIVTVSVSAYTTVLHQTLHSRRGKRRERNLLGKACFKSYHLRFLRYYIYKVCSENVYFKKIILKCILCISKSLF